MSKLRCFKTSDGYTLWTTGMVWTDAMCEDDVDLSFLSNGDGMPIDCFNTPLDGREVKVTLNDKCEWVIRRWNQWSPAERRIMDRIINDDIMPYVRSGEGSSFVRAWCERVLEPALREMED